MPTSPVMSPLVDLGVVAVPVVLFAPLERGTLAEITAGLLPPSRAAAAAPRGGPARSLSR